MSLIGTVFRTKTDQSLLAFKKIFNFQVGNLHMSLFSEFIKCNNNLQKFNLYIGTNFKQSIGLITFDNNKYTDNKVSY